jgi:hypothetical protein
MQMRFNDSQRQQIRTNLQKIVEYIEENILPHITYLYETGSFGTQEIMHGCHIGLNGSYSDKIRFYCSDSWYGEDTLPDEYAVVFLKYWQDAKSYMNTEIKNNEETIKLIENFDV